MCAPLAAHPSCGRPSSAEAPSWPTSVAGSPIRMLDLSPSWVEVGIGKTRLAIEFARRNHESWPGGAVFVELSSATSGPSTAENVGAALGTEVIEGQAPEEAVRRRLRQMPTLVVLDDFDLAGDVVDDLLDLAGLSPKTRFVATAHAPIGHSAERVVRLRPLPTAPDDLADPERLAEVPAVALYVARAVALDPDFALGDSNALAVADLTRRFDGLPLAIELGAARARIMSPKAQLAALEEHSVLDLRAPGSDSRPDRHREVRTAVATSYRGGGRCRAGHPPPSVCLRWWVHQPAPASGAGRGGLDARSDPRFTGRARRPGARRGRCGPGRRASLPSPPDDRCVCS